MAGLLIAGLQANQHFLLPAIAPILYNVGQIFGALILAPQQGITIGSITLPAYGLGVYGIVYGVLIGSVLYLLILIPGLWRYHFQWSPGFGMHDSYVKRILNMLAPRIGNMLCYQLTFIARDNIASYLSEGAPTALTYGWMIQQVPETLIGTAFGTALLPTLSELFARKDHANYHATIEKVERVLIALAIPITIVLSLTLRPFLEFAFNFDSAAIEQMLWVTRGFLIGLLGHCLLELGSRIFFSQQKAVVPFIAAVVNLGIYILAGKLLSSALDAVGVALADSIAFSVQAALLLILFVSKEKKEPPIKQAKCKVPQRSISELSQTIWRTLAGSAAGGAAAWFVLQHSAAYPSLLQGLTSFLVGIVLIIPFIWKELKVFLKL